jgi:alkanesulfonate monooxygenase SsuD/methylene tetrahydromethanopterin reductase-like flavin-dependent oxidoreductase (luciferase family)
MEFIANFMSCDHDPVLWSQQRESEGWHVLGCADHFWSGDRAFPHVWVTLATMAAATDNVLLTTSFANNLFRSPVEFAQASLQLQSVSGGRFEAGLGAGWSKEEAVDSGIGYPDAGVRATRYIEAVKIVRSLFQTNMCTYEGSQYRVNVPVIGPKPTKGPPPLVASLGGDRTIREIAPLVDRVELKLISAATRGGALDLPAARNIPRHHLTELVAKVRAVNTLVPLGVFVLCGVGDDPRTRAIAEMLGDSMLGGFFGSAAKVADSMLALADEGISRVQVSPFNDDAFEQLAAELF